MRRRCNAKHLLISSTGPTRTRTPAALLLLISEYRSQQQRQRRHGEVMNDTTSTTGPKTTATERRRSLTSTARGLSRDALGYTRIAQYLSAEYHDVIRPNF